MKVAIIGSRGLSVRNLRQYLPPGTTELVSGGARGVDSSARQFAKDAHIPIKEFLPDYRLFGRNAPLIRNAQIIEYADIVLAFWDGKSRGTMHVMKLCKIKNKPIKVFILQLS